MEVQSARPLGLPAGCVIPYAGTVAPAGWLMCFGQLVSTTTYAALFAAIGTTYGSGSGTFGLPDLRGRVVAGKDDMGGTSQNRLTGLAGSLDGDILGATGGLETHALTSSEAPNNATIANDNAITGAAVRISAAHTGNGAAHVIVQPTIVLNYMIATGGP
jgi:microcystin-dependent protein